MAARFTAEGVASRPRPAGLSGWVYTAATWCRKARASRAGTAKGGVPIKTTLIRHDFNNRFISTQKIEKTGGTEGL